jgi:hypothetical protein
LSVKQKRKYPCTRVVGFPSRLIAVRWKYSCILKIVAIILWIELFTLFPLGISDWEISNSNGISFSHMGKGEEVG